MPYLYSHLIHDNNLIEFDYLKKMEENYSHFYYRYKHYLVLMKENCYLCLY